MNHRADVTIIGAGISGLSTAYWFAKDGYSVRVLEKSDRPGGSIQTTEKDGFLIEHGPNSGMETNPLIGQLVEDLDLEDQMIYANDEANNRYIVKDGELHKLPMSPPLFLKTKLFSGKAKWRVLGELFVGRAPEGKNETVAEFVQRRLGPEFLDYAINPFVAGVFAGDPKNLSVRAAFPKLVALEDNYGGIFKGVIKGRKERKKKAKEGEESKQSAKMFSFRNGLKTLTDALAKSLGEALVTGVTVESVDSLDEEDSWSVKYSTDDGTETIRSDAVIFAIPAYATADLVESIDSEAAASLNAIPYAKVTMIFSGYNAQDVPIELDGFGYLIPEKEQMNILGTIWTSTIFENRAPDGKVAFTTFVGGARQPEKIDLDEAQLIDEMKADFATLMGIQADPETIYLRKWPKAIPQYTPGHLEREAAMDRFEESHPGLFISGNHRGGISVADCIKNSKPRADSVVNFLDNNSVNESIKTKIAH